MRVVFSIIVFLLLAKSSFASSRCFLYGSVYPRVTAANAGSNFTSMSDRIRLRFDAADDAKCERMIKAYCKSNLLDKNLRPKDLKAYFKPDTDKNYKVNFDVNESCQISKSEENKEDED